MLRLGLTPQSVVKVDTCAHKEAEARQSTRVSQFILFYLAYLIFGSLAFTSSLGSFLLTMVFRSSRAHRFGQKLIHRLFQFFVWYIRKSGLLNLEASELCSLRNSRNLILVANHPSLLDVVIIAAHLPNIVCLMKADIVQNLVLCGQSKLAGYVINKSGAGLIKSCQARLREGSNLLVFPEGTRSNGHLGPFKLGFALLASASRTPIQTIIIDYNHKFLGKGWPFFQPPPFPLNCRIRLGKRFEPDPDVDAHTSGKEVEAYLHEILETVYCT